MAKSEDMPRADAHDWKRTNERTRICAACGREELHIPGRPIQYSGGVGYAPKLEHFPGACVDTTSWEKDIKEGE